MNIAYFDCFSGVSGDMMLGALVDLGIDISALDATLRELGLGGFKITSEKTLRKSISTINLRVETEESHHHRHLKDILNIIDSPVLSDTTKERITKVFTKIGEAESKIHNIPVDKIHFHEVGALDSMIDIIGTLWGLEQLNIGQFYSSAITVGSGSVKCAHGIVPVPSPATLEIVKGFPVRKKEVETELATPTGTALVTCLAEYSSAIPQMAVKRVGYGCGDKDFEEFANIFRIILGETTANNIADTISILETSIDDMESEYYPYVMDKLFTAGALDVYITPIIMKKGRPGNQLTVLAESHTLNNCLDTIFKETTTSGIRIIEAGRQKLERTVSEIVTPWGTMKVKKLFHNGISKITPEYEECKRVAEKERIPLLDVYNFVKQLDIEENDTVH